MTDVGKHEGRPATKGGFIEWTITIHCRSRSYIQDAWVDRERAGSGSSRLRTAPQQHQPRLFYHDNFIYLGVPLVASSRPLNSSDHHDGKHCPLSVLNALAKAGRKKLPHPPKPHLPRPPFLRCRAILYLHSLHLVTSRGWNKITRGRVLIDCHRSRRILTNFQRLRFLLRWWISENFWFD